MSEQKLSRALLGLRPIPLTREALARQARMNGGSRITPAATSGGHTAFTVTFPDAGSAVAFATTIDAVGWNCDTRLVRPIADLTDPVTLTVTGPVS